MLCKLRPSTWLAAPSELKATNLCASGTFLNCCNCLDTSCCCMLKGWMELILECFVSTKIERLVPVCAVTGSPTSVTCILPINQELSGYWKHCISQGHVDHVMIAHCECSWYKEEQCSWCKEWLSFHELSGYGCEMSKNCMWMCTYKCTWQWSVFLDTTTEWVKLAIKGDSQSTSNLPLIKKGSLLNLYDPTWAMVQFIGGAVLIDVSDPSWSPAVKGILWLQLYL